MPKPPSMLRGGQRRGDPGRLVRVSSAGAEQVADVAGRASRPAACRRRGRSPGAGRAVRRPRTGRGTARAQAVAHSASGRRPASPKASSSTAAPSGRLVRRTPAPRTARSAPRRAAVARSGSRRRSPSSPGWPGRAGGVDVLAAGRRRRRRRGRRSHASAASRCGSSSRTSASGSPHRHASCSRHDPQRGRVDRAVVDRRQREAAGRARRTSCGASRAGSCRAPRPGRVDAVPCRRASARSVPAAQLGAERQQHPGRPELSRPNRVRNQGAPAPANVLGAVARGRSARRCFEVGEAGRARRADQPRVLGLDAAPTCQATRREPGAASRLVRRGAPVCTRRVDHRVGSGRQLTGKRQHGGSRRPRRG